MFIDVNSVISTCGFDVADSLMVSVLVLSADFWAVRLYFRMYLKRLIAFLVSIFSVLEFAVSRKQFCMMIETLLQFFFNIRSLSLQSRIRRTLWFVTNNASSLNIRFMLGECHIICQALL